jgi:hypothetical protein
MLDTLAKQCNSWLRGRKTGICFLRNTGRIQPTESKTFLTQEDCGESSLANKLLLLDDVEIVFFGNDFITLTKVLQKAGPQSFAL